MTVVAARSWDDNAEMILDVVELGYIRPLDRLLDLTFGQGTWWRLYDHPGWFVANVETLGDADACKAVDAQVSWDFRKIPFLPTVDHNHGMFEVVTFDPPYVSMGGRATSGLPDFMDRYGLRTAASSPSELHAYNVLGLREAARMVMPNGLVLVKCAPYISSGKYQAADVWMHDAAIDEGFTVQDRFIHVGNIRPQPGGRTVKHARNNYSVLWVFRKPRRRK